MLSEHLSNIDGVSVFPIISLIAFFLFFAVTIIWVFRLDKKYIIRMGNLPLELNSENENNLEIENEVNK